MSTNEYTPTTEEIREAYRYETGGDGCSVRGDEALPEFDRWLAGVVADARREERERITKITEKFFEPDWEWALWNREVAGSQPVPSRVVVKETGIS